MNPGSALTRAFSPLFLALFSQLRTLVANVLRIE
jgi:hypothetical protein